MKQNQKQGQGVDQSAEGKSDLPPGAVPVEFAGEFITPDERDYMTTVREQMKEAQAAARSYHFHLSRKYRLGPRDGIDEQGRIIRAEDHADNAEN